MIATLSTKFSLTLFGLNPFFEELYSTHLLTDSHLANVGEVWLVMVISNLGNSFLKHAGQLSVTDVDILIY